MTSVALILTMLLLPFSNLLNVKAAAVTIVPDESRTLASDKNFEYVTNTTKLTINDGSDTTFVAYKILDTYYNSTSNEITYDFTTDFKAFLAQLSEDDSFKDLTIANYQELTGGSYKEDDNTLTLNKLVSKYATYLKKVKNITGIDLSKENSAGNTAEVEVGSYLILPSNVAEKITTSGSTIELILYTYSVTVANIVFKVGNNGWDLSNVEIMAKSTFLDNYHMLVNKNIKSLEDIQEIFADITYSASEDLYFIPTGDRGYQEPPTNANSSILNNTEIMSKIGKKEFTFPKGMTLDSIYTLLSDGKTIIEAPIRDDSIYVMDDDDNEIKYANITNDTVNNKLIFSNVNFDTLNILFFKLKVNNDISVGSTTDAEKLDDYGNKIITNVTYLKDAYVDITGMDQATAEAAVLGTGTITNIVYTHGVKVTNKNSDGNTLTGGVFNICTDKDCNTVIGTTSITNDVMQFRGLNDTDTYYLKQVTAPTGYRLLSDAIELNPTSLDKEVGLYDVTVTNTKMGLLPSTGGLGTIFYTLVGLIVIGIGSYAVIKYSKKQVNS